MKKFWIDIFNGPHVHFFQNIKTFVNEFIFTNRNYLPIPELMKLYNIKSKQIGKHGGRDNFDKLIASQKRVIELAKYIKSQNVEILIHKHSVEAARVAWGLGLPSISYIDNELMVPQNMLVCPLTNVLIAPLAISQYVLRNFTPSHVSILQFDGVCEVANVSNFKPNENILKFLNLTPNKPIFVIRGEPILAAYNGNTDSICEILISKIKSQIKDAQIIIIPREGDANRTEFPVIDARSLSYFADVVISGGGTMAREASLLGTNAVTYFYKPLAVDKYLIGKKMLISFPGKEILTVDWKKILRIKKRKVNLENFEHPFSLISKAEKLIEIKNGK